MPLTCWYTLIQPPTQLFYRIMEEEEYLMKCVVDPVKRTFYLYSSEGDTKQVDCNNVEEFMNVLELVRATCPEERLVYADPLSGKKEV